MTSPNSTVATSIRLARHSLWLALGLIVLLGVGALLLNIQPDGSAAHYFGKIMLFLPLVIVIAVAWLGTRTGARAGTSSTTARVVREDELRQLAMQRAFRAGFLAMLLSQPLLLVWFIWMPLLHEAAIMASVTVLAGAVVFFGVFLFCDRA